MNPAIFAALARWNNFRGGPIVETPHTSPVPWHINPEVRPPGPSNPNFRVNPGLLSTIDPQPSTAQTTPRLLRQQRRQGDDNLAVLPAFQRIAHLFTPGAYYTGGGNYGTTGGYGPQYGSGAGGGYVTGDYTGIGSVDKMAHFDTGWTGGLAGDRYRGMRPPNPF